jgi:hypothetical protein
MARFLTMLTLALVTATQTAQAFPHIRNYNGFRAGRHERSESVSSKETNGLRGSVTANFLEAEELFGDYYVQIERVVGNCKLDSSLVRNCLQILEVAAEEDPALADAFESVLEMHLDDDATLEVMLVLLAIEAEKSAAWIDSSIPPHRNRR